jgi:hypothetical protein
MKKSAIISLLICSNFAFAQTFEKWDNPSRTIPIQSTEVKVKVLASENVMKDCDAESRRRGFNGFTVAMNSCAFWNGEMTQCTIIVPKKTTMHLLGHEMLHCIKGDWHQ